MAGPFDYRDVQAPTQVETNLPGSGAAERAQQLAATFKQFSGDAQDVADKINTSAGAIAGAAAGATGNPNYREGLERFTAYSRAYNHAATGAYAVQAEAAAEDDAARLRVQANNDPNTFRTTYAAVRDAVVKNAPPEAQGMLAELYNRHLAAGIAAVSGAQAEEIHQTQKATYDMGVQRAITRVATLQGSSNPQDQLQGDDEHAKLSALITGGVNAGMYSPAEGAAMQVNAARAITSQVFETQVDRELGRMSQSSMVSGGQADSGDVVKLLDNFRAMHEKNSADTNQPQILSEPEFNQLMSNAKQKLQQENLLEQYNRRSSKSAEELKLENGDRTITVAMATPNADPTILRTMVQDMVHTGDLKPEVGRAVLSSLQRGADAAPNKEGLFRALNDPARFDWKPADIAAKVNIGEMNWQQALELTQKIETQRQGWEGHAAIKDARASVTASLKLPPGITFETASDEQKKAITNAQVELTKQLNALPVDKRDGEASRIASNVALEIQAREADAKTAVYARQRGYLDKTYGPGGSSFRSDADYAARKAQLDASVKAAQDQAVQLRKGIK